ncbi:MAG: type II secretion system protein [Candidatus Saccharimonas sp.]
MNTTHTTKKIHLPSGFTLVELIVMISVLAILVVATIVVYKGVQQRSASAVTQHTVADALKNLQLYYIANKNYPSNIANTDYAPPLSVAVSLYTNAPQTPTYQNLSSEQNAQLFLNSCNGFMPIESGGTTYSTSCVFNGNNMHVKGQTAANVVINGPTINQSSFVLSCGSACTTAQNNILSIFTEQGGTFPITVPKKGSALPQPVMVNTGTASRFCVEGRSGQFNTVMYYATSENQVVTEGACPTDAALHYP